MTLSEKWDGNAVEAVQDYLQSRTVPLLLRGSGASDELHVQGTAMPFEASGRRFLVTAQHVLNGIYEAGREILVPVYPGHSADLRALDLSQWKGLQDPYDIAVVELGGELVDQMEQGWRFAGIEELGGVGSMDYFIVAGYPQVLGLTEHNRRRPTTLLVNAHVYSGPTSEVAQPYQPSDHILLEHKKTGFAAEDPTDLSGYEQHESFMPGFSGAPVWVVGNHSSSDVWSPRSDLRCCAIQTSYKRGHYIKCTRWQAMADVFDQFDPSIGSSIRTVSWQIYEP